MGRLESAGGVSDADTQHAQHGPQDIPARTAGKRHGVAPYPQKTAAENKIRASVQQRRQHNRYIRRIMLAVAVKLDNAIIAVFKRISVSGLKRGYDPKIAGIADNFRPARVASAAVASVEPSSTTSTGKTAEPEAATTPSDGHRFVMSRD